MEKALVDERFKDIEENYKHIKENIQKATLESGRDEDSVRLMGVTKTVDSLYINHALSLGIDLIGENRVQEYLGKRDELHLDGVEKHLIGHLQTNKVRQVVGKVDLIQSVDSLRLLEAISKEAQRLGVLQDILLEVNIGGESAKTGFSPEEVLPLVDKIDSFSNVRVRGLMAIPPIARFPGDNLKFFQKIIIFFSGNCSQKSV